MIFGVARGNDFFPWDDLQIYLKYGGFPGENLSIFPLEKNIRASDHEIAYLNMPGQSQQITKRHF